MRVLITLIVLSSCMAIVACQSEIANPGVPAVSTSTPSSTLSPIAASTPSSIVPSTPTPMSPPIPATLYAFSENDTSARHVGDWSIINATELIPEEEEDIRLVISDGGIPYKGAKPQIAFWCNPGAAFPLTLILGRAGASARYETIEVTVAGQLVKERWQSHYDVYGGLTIWTSPPDIARQVLAAILGREVENVSVRIPPESERMILPTRGLREAMESIHSDCLVSQRLNAVMEDVAPSVVRILQNDCRESECLVGSGFIYYVDDEGRAYVVTTSRVVEGHSAVTVRSNASEYIGEVIGRDRSKDLVDQHP